VGLRKQQELAAPREKRGRLVVVECADAGRLDLMLSAARRHLSPGTALSFVEPMGTRRLPAGSGVVIGRRALRDLERMGGFCLVWQSGAERYGLSVSLLARLSAGETVVIGSDVDISSDARAIWPKVSVVRLLSRTDRLRTGLSLRASFARIAGRQHVKNDHGRMREQTPAAAVPDDGNLAITVRRLAQVLASLAPVRPADVGQPAPLALVKPPSDPPRIGRRRFAKVAMPESRTDLPRDRLVRPREPL
jgi:ribose 1,5-bisphosphokinase PhnN